jgi:hypothetical protein
VRTYKPGKKAGAVYEKLYAVYKRTHDFFGRENAALMKSLRETAVCTQEGLK